MADYNIHEVSGISGITVRSLRNYLRLYGEHFSPARGACNSLIFNDEDVKTFVRIRTYLREGKDRSEIHKILEEGQPEGELVVRSGSPAPESTGRLEHQLETQTQLLTALVQENQKLRQRLDVMEVRLGLRLDGPPRAQLEAPGARPKSRSGSLALPLPYFLTRWADGARAGVAALRRLVFGRPQRENP